MDLVSVRTSIATGFAQYAVYDLSFWGEDGYSHDQVLAMVNLPNPRVRLSSVGALRGLGYEPVRTQPWPHLEVRFETDPTDEELERLIRVFEAPIPNPWRRQ